MIAPASAGPGPRTGASRRRARARAGALGAALGAALVSLVPLASTAGVAEPVRAQGRAARAPSEAGAQAPRASGRAAAAPGRASASGTTRAPDRAAGSGGAEDRAGGAGGGERLPGGRASAHREAPPADLGELLRRVRDARREQREIDARREAEFRRRRADQKRLLEEAERRRDAARRRADELEAAFEANEEKIAGLEKARDAKVGALGELFGTVRQAAGEAASTLRSSIVSAERPGRAAALRRLAEADELPEAKDLDLLWTAILEEAIEDGRVVRFPADVVSADGGVERREVVRIGAFDLVSGDRYLLYLPESGEIAEPARQPARRFRSLLAAFVAAREGYAPVAIDPSRGALLSLLGETPDLRERLRQGGPVGYAIVLLGLLGAAVAAERLVSLGRLGRRMRAQRSAREVRDDNPLGRVLAVYDRDPDADVETLELRLDEAILREVPSLERGQGLLRLVSVVAPLLGLLGTVTGMIATFQAITLFGAGDPRRMAGGISQALVTTVLGLVVAIPMLLAHGALASRSRSLVQILEEQSAGLVARRAERRRALERRKAAAADHG